MSRTVGVVPAAGHARRLPGLGHSKEVHPVAGRPVIAYVLERMLAAAPAAIRVVVRPEKTDVAEEARRHGAEIVTGYPPSAARSIALAIGDLDADDTVLIGFPDTVWQPLDGFRRLVAVLAPPVDVALGLFRTSDLTRSDVVSVDREGTVTSLEVKPAEPRSDTIWGCAAARARALRGLAGVSDPGELFGELVPDGVVRGVHLSDEWVDIGTPAGLAAASRFGP